MARSLSRRVEPEPTSVICALKSTSCTRACTVQQGVVETLAFSPAHEQKAKMTGANRIWIYSALVARVRTRTVLSIAICTTMAAKGLRLKLSPAKKSKKSVSRESAGSAADAEAKHAPVDFASLGWLELIAPEAPDAGIGTQSSNASSRVKPVVLQRTSSSRCARSTPTCGSL
jgi:hypothetical protein